MNDWLPYGRQTIGEEEQALVREVLEGDWLTQGPRVPQFEAALTAVCDAPHAVAVSHGTAALHLACLAAGLGPGDKFLTSPITFAATANAGLMCGAEPVFVDIDPDSLNLDSHRAAAALEQDPAIKVILPVHLGGRICEMDKLAGLAAVHEAVIIEDACHAIGGEWIDGGGLWHRVGSCSRSLMTCFSFHPVKTLTTGEGGAITTRDEELAERLRRLRTHGITKDPERMQQNDGGWYYEMQELGVNARLTDLQAALGLAQLKHLDDWRRRRRELVLRYDRAFHDMPQVRIQARPRPVDRSCWHLMILRTSRRAELYEHLHAAGIGAQVHYVPVHLQPYYRDRFGLKPGDFPCAEAYYREAISLPLFPAMSDADCDRVVRAVWEFHHG